MKHERRVLSGIQPSGSATLGNYVGALKFWVEDQDTSDCLYCIVDLHALTVDQDPASLREQTLQLAALLLAVGIDPNRSTLFLQSQVPHHAELSWIMECVATYGELSRMTQFKDKGKGSSTVRASLFTYPALMAADILLYRATHVPVGDDQKQHLELTRNLATRFNNRYGETFVIPEPEIPKVGARVMDLQDPTRKMSKSSKSDAGNIYLTDTKDAVAKKVQRAVTDTENKVYFDPNNPGKAGVNNLLSIFSALKDEEPNEIAARYSGYGHLKSDLTEVINETLTPIRTKIEELRNDDRHLIELLHNGAEKAAVASRDTLRRAKSAMGLIPWSDGS
jgi:tryptophanyl-tRNA synthetase